MYFSILIILAAYTAGSINFSILLFKGLKKGDPRDKFSKNPGATNVYRQAGLFWAIIVLFLDMGRAMAIAGTALYFSDPRVVPWVGLGLIAGNRFPLFHGFKGGKGVANFLGFSLVLIPVWALCSGIAWIIVHRISKAPFLGSFTMVIILCTGTILRFKAFPYCAAGTIATGLLIIINHKSNIKEFLKVFKN